MNDEINEDEMPKEVDFSDGVRGKHGETFRERYRVRIIRDDGTIEERAYAPQGGAVVIDPDLRERFPDSESVNRALRSLVESE